MTDRTRQLEARVRAIDDCELVYLACPYTHDDPAIEEKRFQAVNLVASRLLNEGVNVHSPISHSRPIAQAGGLPEDWEFWKKYDRAFLSLCSKLVVLCLDGWKVSTGVTAEIEIALEFGIPIEYIEVEEANDVRVS